jgi:hypothetical protein
MAICRERLKLFKTFHKNEKRIYAEIKCLYSVILNFIGSFWDRKNTLILFPFGLFSTIRIHFGLNRAIIDELSSFVDVFLLTF